MQGTNPLKPAAIPSTFLSLKIGLILKCFIEVFGIPFLFLMSFVVTVVLCRKTEEIAYVQMVTVS